MQIRTCYVTAAVFGFAGVSFGAPTDALDAPLVINDAPLGVILDVDGDGTDDLEFVYAGDSVNGAFGWNAQARRSTSTTTFFATARDDNGRIVHVALSENGTVDAVLVSGLDQGDFGYDLFNFGQGGAWLGGDRRYMGFSFRIDGRRHFGWALVELDNQLNPGAGSMIVHRIAYESDPETPILTGSPTDAPPCAADFAEPFGVLNFFDVAAFIAAYNAMDASADLAEPFGSFNFFDVAEYVGAYNAGCP